MPEPVIKIHDLSKDFLTERGDLIQALEHIHLEVTVNDFLCLVGPSGCGKSTLLRIVAGLEQASAGAVFFRGSPLTRPHREIGMVFQEYSLLPWRSVQDNVSLGPEFQGKPKRERRQIAHQFLHLVRMDRFARSYPYELSGGMQQRVAIARALANNPEVLLMDEPFGALDAHTRILLQKELLRIWGEHRKTILFVTHSVDEALYLADRIVVMSARPGKIREILEVPLSRPRDRANPWYSRMAVRILNWLEEEVSAGPPHG
jgi:NitT/TauT family transport system ATP-binding protein